LKKSLLGDSAAVKSAAVRALFLGSVAVTISILLWTQHIKLAGFLPIFTSIYFVLLARDDSIGAMVLLLVLLCCALLPARPAYRSALHWVGAHPGVVAGLSAVIMMGGSLFVYHNHRLSLEEYAAYFQSQIFAAGHLAGRIPPALLDWVIPPDFQQAFINVSHTSGRVAGGYWPGFSLILAPFTWAGISWACNPVISALTLLAMHRLALGLFQDTEAAGMTLLLAAASPVIFADGISYYSLAAHLLANTLYALLLVRPTLKRAFLAGVVGSIALTLHNPVPHILFCIPWLLWLITRKGGASLLGAACLGYLPLCVVIGLGWYWYSGNLLHEDASGVKQVIKLADNQQDLRLLFQFPHVSTLIIRLVDLAKLWLWAVPGMLILACVGAWRWRHNATCLLLAGSALATLIGYLFFPWDQGHGWGDRYFHAAWVALPLLATAAMYRPADPAPAMPQAVPNPVMRMFEDPATQLYVTACIGLMLVVGVGSRALQIQRVMAIDLNQVPHYHGTERRVVVIDDTLSFYGVDLVQNDPWLRGSEIRMYSQGAAANARMMAANLPSMHIVFADHHGWVWSAMPLTVPPHAQR
jgi:hypothetical protein